MNFNQAKGNINRAWIISAAGLVLFFPCIFLMGLGAFIVLPWMFPGYFTLPLLITVPLLTFLVYKKSRIGAVLLFLVYLLNRAFVFVGLAQLGEDPAYILLLWLIPFLLWGFFFVQGIRGTFVYQSVRRRAEVASYKAVIKQSE